MKSTKELMLYVAFWPWYVCVCFQSFVYRYANVFLFIAGCVIIHLGFGEILFAQTDPAITFDTTEIDRATCSMYALLEGPYGALLTATAGFSALVAAVMGSYQSAYTLLTVGIGCFIARSVNSMYFGVIDCDSDNLSDNLKGLSVAIQQHYSNEGDGAGMINK